MWIRNRDPVTRDPGWKILSGSGINIRNTAVYLGTILCRTSCGAVTWACFLPTTNPGATHLQSAPSWVSNSTV
jgi:hypothetical protein